MSSQLFETSPKAQRKQLYTSQAGASFVEIAIVLALVAVVALASISELGRVTAWKVGCVVPAGFGFADFNNDGTVNLLDVSPYSEELSNIDSGRRWLIDYNCDMVIDGQDIAIFVSIMGG